MQKKCLTCVICPKGCALEADIAGNQIKELRGNGCKRGISYAESEIFHAERMLTTTVMVKERRYMLPVRTKTAIPREKVMACMEYLRTVKVATPIKTHDIIVSDILGTGVDIIASSPYL